MSKDKTKQVWSVSLILATLNTHYMLHHITLPFDKKNERKKMFFPYGTDNGNDRIELC